MNKFLTFIISLFIIFVVIGIIAYNYFREFNIIVRIQNIETKVDDIRSDIKELKKWQNEIISKLNSLEKQLDKIESQNSYTQYLVEKNNIDMKYLLKQLGEDSYLNELKKLYKKYSLVVTPAKQ